jgi:hypothetical protein
MKMEVNVRKIIQNVRIMNMDQIVKLVKKLILIVKNVANLDFV